MQSYVAYSQGTNRGFTLKSDNEMVYYRMAAQDLLHRAKTEVYQSSGIILF